MNRSRAAQGVLAAGAAAFAVAVLILSRTPGPRAWALHLPGFLSGPARSFVLALLVAGAGLLVFDFLRGAPPRDAVEGARPKAASARGAKRRAAREHASRSTSPIPEITIPGWAVWMLLLPWIWTLWRLETRTRFLGDGTVWLDGIRNGNPSPFSEPLAAAAWAGYSHLLRALKLPIDPVTAGLLPIFCGVLAVVLFWGIASEITRQSGSRVAAFAVLATMGVVQLYFGYIESYPVVSVALLAYLWLGLRTARGAGSLLFPAMALAVAIASHLSCAFLAPSFLYLAWRGQESLPKRVAITLAAPVAAALLLILLGYPPSRWIGAFAIAARAVESGHGPALFAKPYGVFSFGHASDVVNAILLAMPVPAMLLLAGTIGNWSASPIRLFLLLAAVPGFALAAALVLPVAPAQDWDLSATLLLPMAVLGVYAGFSIPRLPMRGFRGLGLAALGAGALLSFVLVNAGVESGLNRYETIVGPGARITRYARAYGNELLATYDVERKDYARAVIHAQRALDAEPTNPRYWIKKGAALFELQRYDEAIPVLEEGIRRGPARDDSYYDLGNCYARQKRFPEAAVVFREAIRLGHPRPDYYNNLAVALFYSGKPDSARALWTEVTKRWPWYVLSKRSLIQHFGSDGSDSAQVTPARG